jgi:chromosome partitioning protein
VSLDAAVALGWPGTDRGSEHPVGWLGVSRETSLRSHTRPIVGPGATDGVPATQAPHVDQEVEDAGVQDAGVQDAGVQDAKAISMQSPLSGPITASQVAAESPGHVDTSVPFAQATEHSLAVAERRNVRRSLPKPAQTRVIVVANQKGGVGKTTTAVNVAAALAQHGMRVLVVDLDPQGNASTALAVDHTEGTPGAYQVLVEGTPIAHVVKTCPDIDGLMVVPATIDLAGAEIELVSLVARETRLRKALTTYLSTEADEGRPFDYVFIDCPPSLGLLTVNALSAGNEMLIPIQCEYYALEGLSQLLRTLDQIHEHLNPELELGAIILTMFDGRTRLAAGVVDEVREHFGDQVLSTAIPRSVRISEAPSYGQTVLTYDPGSPGALSYLEAASELANQVKEAV